MSRFVTLLKMNIKLLLRNKGFLFFLCITPIVSAAILGINAEYKLYSDENTDLHIIELEKSTDRAVYVSDTTAFVVKVYDASKTELSEYVLKELSKSGMFSVCRCDVRGMSDQEVLEQAKKDAFDDRAGTLLYLKKDFNKGILAGNYEEAFQIYDVSEDERWELFEAELTSILSRVYQLSANVGMLEENVLEVLDTMEENIPSKEQVNLSGKDEIGLTKEQEAQKSNIGYAFAIITLGFLFCGVCVAHTVIEEQNNKVYTRVLLSKVSRTEYLCSKLSMVAAISIMQTIILCICIMLLGDINFGVNRISLLLVIFLLGLIFSTISFLLGVLLGDILSANYAVFSVWSISALLAGLYFPLDSSTTMIKAISYLMPQRWFMRAMEMLLVGDNGAYSMLIYITAAYLIVIISVGSIGLKMKHWDS